MRKIQELAKINKKHPEFNAYLNLANFILFEDEIGLELWLQYARKHQIKNAYDKQMFMKKLLDGGRPLLEKIKPVIKKTTGEIYCNANCLAAIVALGIKEISYDHV